MTYAESLGTLIQAIALVLIRREHSTTVLRCTCFSPEDIISAINLANQSDVVKVQVL